MDAMNRGAAPDPLLSRLIGQAGCGSVSDGRAAAWARAQMRGICSAQHMYSHSSSRMARSRLGALRYGSAS